MNNIESKFPEKWCIEVTEDNYQELKTWIYRNVGNYRSFKDGWFTNKRSSIGNTLYSHALDAWNLGYDDVFYEIITTDEFRAKYGDLNQKENTIDPIALIEWMWHNVMQQDGYRWITGTLDADLTSEEVLQLYKESLKQS